MVYLTADCWLGWFGCFVICLFRFCLVCLFLDLFWVLFDLVLSGIVYLVCLITWLGVCWMGLLDLGWLVGLVGGMCCDFCYSFWV